MEVRKAEVLLYMCTCYSVLMGSNLHLSAVRHSVGLGLKHHHYDRALFPKAYTTLVQLHSNCVSKL